MKILGACESVEGEGGRGGEGGRTDRHWRKMREKTMVGRNGRESAGRKGKAKLALASG